MVPISASTVSLAMAIVLAQHIKQETAQPRVAIVLPPSFGGLLANVAVILAGKIR